MIGPQPHSPPPPPSSSSSSPPPPPTNNRLLNLAPGFGFHPTDEELVCYYLKRKSSNLPSITTAIADVDVYKHSPWDLPALSPLSRSSTWYFFTSLDLLPHVSLNPRVHRAAPAGYWKSTGNDRVVRRHSEGGGGGDVVGMKKTLVFHLGRAPQGGRTDWVMHEYRQVEKDNNGRKGCFVLCRVYKKSGHGATRAFYHGAPFVEEEWEGEAATALTCNALSDDVEQATLSLNLVRSNILAPGFRFHPTDEELISYYLKRKALGLPLCVDAIVEVDLYKRAPWQLPPMSPLRDKEWYFFSPLDHKYTNGSRIDRATPHGYWKSTGVDRVIHSHDGSTVIGMKKSLVLHLGRAPHGRRTDWVMHEYFRVKDGKDPIGLFVVCRIFQKSGHGAQRGVHYGAPFVEEEWEEIVVEDSPDASMRDTAGAGEKDHVHSDNAEQGTTKAMFSIGGLVEVAYMNNKLPIAWYTATVIEVVNKNIFLVEYESLRTEDDILLREIVSSQYIRPCPPPTLDKHFNLLDEVEAFYRSGWWQGVIARLNPGSKYNVKLMHWEEEIEFSHTELRLLYDWVDGQWIQSSQDKSIELQDICIPESVDHESNSASTNYENENSDKNELDDFHPCKKARIGAIIKDNTRLVDSRVTNTSSAVNAGFDVRTPILEKEPNSHAKGLVNEGCSAKSLNATNVNSLDSMSRLSSTNLLGEINEDPVVPQKLSQEAVMFQKSPASNREELTKEKSVNTEAQVYERGKYSGVWLLTGYQRRKEPVRECRSQEEEAVRQQTTTEERRENGRPITFSINELSLEGDSVDIKQNNEVVGEPPNQGHSTVQCDTCSDLKALSLVASLVDTSACGVQPITAGREAGNEVLLSIGGNNLAKRGLVQHAEDSAENIQDVKLVEKRAIQELSTFQCAHDNSVNPSSGSIDIGSCEFLISGTNYENKNSDRSTSQNHLEHLHPCKKMKIGETIEGLTNTSPVKAGFDVRTPIIEEEPNSRIKDFLNKGCCTSSFNMVNVNTRLADAGVTSTSTAVKAGLDVGKPIIEEEPNSCVEASVNMGCSTSSSNMVNVASLDSMVRLSSSILLGETNEGLVVPESLPQETIMFQKSSGNNGEDSKKKFVNTEGLQTYDGEESGGVCPLTDCQQRKDPVHECLNQGNEAVRQHTTLEEKRGNSRPNTFSIKELSSEGDSMEIKLNNEVVEETPIEGHSTVQRGTSSGSETSSDSSLVETSTYGIHPSEAGSDAENVILLSNRGNQLTSRVLIGNVADAFKPMLIQCIGQSAGNIRENRVLEAPPIEKLSTIVCGTGNNIDMEAQESFNVTTSSSDARESASEAQNEVLTATVGKLLAKGTPEEVGYVFEPRLDKSPPENEGGASVSLGKCAGDPMGNEEEDKVMGDPPTSDASLVENSTFVVQSSESRSEAQNERGNQVGKWARIKNVGDAFGTRLDKSPSTQTPLPFDKCSPMWAAIESMEVFSEMPQQPHFRPLERYNREFREGMAIGLMVTFSNLVNSIGKLQLDDSRHKFNGIMKNLVQLEGHGFNVQHKQAQLLKLLRMRDSQEQLLDNRSRVKSLLMKNKRDIDCYSAEIESIEKAARNLEQSLSHIFNEKNYLLEKSRENKSMLDKIELDSRAVNDALLTAEHDFEATLSAPW